MGSSSLSFESQAHKPDPLSDPIPEPQKQHELICAAKALSPALEDAEIISNWAGIRPKAWARDPIIGACPTNPNLIIASGGFKISFGIAHHIADYIDQTLSDKQQQPITLPHSFQPSHHLDAFSDTF